MKALIPMTVKFDGKSFKLRPGTEIPAVVVDFWKKTDQTSELVKNKAVSDDSVKSTPAASQSQPENASKK